MLNVELQLFNSRVSSVSPMPEGCQDYFYLGWQCLVTLGYRAPLRSISSGHLLAKP